MTLRLLCRLLFLPFLFLSCTPSKRPSEITTFTGIAMTIEYQIIIGTGLDEKQSKTVQETIQKVFDEVNKIYNNWNPNSEVSRLNRLKAYQKAVLSPQLEKLLKITNEIVVLSQGKFDPTIAPVQDLWKSRISQGRIPESYELEHAIQWVGWNKIHFEHGYFWKESTETALDLGGIAKGYAIDLLLENLQSIGYSDIYVEWGGEIRAAGQHPAGRPWTVFISRLGDSDPSHAVDIIPLENEAIATSGDYMQNWTVDLYGEQKTLFHITNPKTYRPLSRSPGSIASVSLIAPTCVVADGLATAAMIFDSAAEAEQWLHSIPGVKLKKEWIVTEH